MNLRIYAAETKKKINRTKSKIKHHYVNHFYEVQEYSTYTGNGL